MPAPGRQSAAQPRRESGLGTRAENMRDKAIHGTEIYGEMKPNHVITADQARAIRIDTRASRVVGRDYGISHTAVLRIRRGQRWRAA